MKTRICSLIASLLALAGLFAAAPAPMPGNEDQLIQILGSSASPAEKDAACARLKFIGTARAIPALAALLTDEQLCHSACYALEPMPYPAAGKALVNALDKTTGLTKVGIIDSLGARREASAVTPLSRLLADSDPLVASAAAGALGRLGGSDALKALQAASGNAADPLRRALVDGQLQCANQWLVAGSLREARAVFEKLFATEKSDLFRLAAYRGMILSSGKDGLSLMVRALQGEPGPAQLAALQLVNVLHVPDTATTKTLAGLLPKAAAPLQVALIDGLAQRNDSAAAAPIAALSSGAVTEVRLSIIKALSSLGDASVIPLLSDLAATGTPAEQKAARETLVDLRRGNITDALLARLSTAGPAAQAELARAVGARGDTAALPKLVELARQGPAPVRDSALKALGSLVDQPQLDSLVRLVVDARDPAGRAQAAEALNTACQHIRSRHGRLDPKPLTDGLAAGSADARIALLPICGGIIAPETRAALRASLGDTDPNVREAAIRSLCDTTDVELLDDVVRLAQQTKEENFRMLAIAAVVRLTTEEKAGLSNDRRVAALQGLLSGPAERPEQKRLVLAGLSEVPDLAALKLVEPTLADPAVQTEAELAAVKIASALPASETAAARESLQKTSAGATHDETRQRIAAVLRLLEASTDYLADWQVAGPYRQEGKDYTALFDTVFPPETDAAKGVNWRALKAVGGPRQAAAVDLLKALGGTQCVAYARTWVRSDQDQAAELELGSDDGAKVWLNGKEVFALNTARALRPGSDKANVQLHKGWNQVLFKVTQNNQGWGFCARLRNPDGSPIAGLRCESAPKFDSTDPGTR